ncbi:unnamed protein product [Penicillium palitans]
MIGILVCGYLRKILELYSPRFRESPEARVAEACARIFSWPSQADINAFNAAAHADQLARERLVLVGLNGLREYFVLVSVIAGELRGSFFGEIVWFLFYSTFALCQVCFFIVWGSGSDWRAPISFTPQFGQILSLDDSASSLYWMAIEFNLGLVAGSLSSLRPLPIFRRFGSTINSGDKESTGDKSHELLNTDGSDPGIAKKKKISLGMGTTILQDTVNESQENMIHGTRGDYGHRLA